MTLAAGLLLAKREPAGDEAEPVDEPASVRPWIGLAVILVDAVLFVTAGFIPATVVGMLLWLRIVGQESWKTTLIFTPIFTAGLYLVFVAGLGVRFPSGIVAELVSAGA